MTTQQIGTAEAPFTNTYRKPKRSRWNGHRQLHANVRNSLRDNYEPFKNFDSGKMDEFVEMSVGNTRGGYVWTSDYPKYDEVVKCISKHKAQLKKFRKKIYQEHSRLTKMGFTVTLVQYRAGWNRGGRPALLFFGHDSTEEADQQPRGMPYQDYVNNLNYTISILHYYDPAPLLNKRSQEIEEHNLQHNVKMARSNLERCKSDLASAQKSLDNWLDDAYVEEHIRLTIERATRHRDQAQERLDRQAKVLADRMEAAGVTE